MGLRDRVNAKRKAKEAANQSETRKHDPKEKPKTESKKPNWEWVRNAGKSAQSKGDRKSFVIILLRIFLFVVGGFVIWLNIMPYMDGVTKLLDGAGMHPLIQFFARLPVIGWIINTLHSIATSLIGIALWGVFQLLELLPLLMMGSQKQIRQVIAGLSQIKSLPINNDDPEFIRRLTVKHNRLPAEWVSNAKKAASIVYIVDAAFCLWYYPPLKTDLSLWLMAPSMSDVDFKNLILAAATLVAVELVVSCWLWLHNGRYFLGGGKTQHETA